MSPRGATFHARSSTIPSPSRGERLLERAPRHLPGTDYTRQARRHRRRAAISRVGRVPIYPVGELDAYAAIITSPLKSSTSERGSPDQATATDAANGSPAAAESKGLFEPGSGGGGGIAAISARPRRMQSRS